MIFSPHFHFKAFPEKKRERERVRARERRRNRIVSPMIADGLRAPGDADLQFDDRREDRDRRHDLTPSQDRAVDCDLAFDRDRDQRCDLATRRSRDRVGEIAISDRDC